MRIRELCEGITIDAPQQRLNFNYNDPRGTSTTMGKGTAASKFTPFLTKSKALDGYSVYSVYTSKDPSTTDVLKAIKRKSGIQMNEADYQHFITRTAIFITSKILAPMAVDCIITPKSSSNVLNDLIVQLQSRNPHITFLPESFVKTVDLSKIEVDTTQPGITPAIAKTLSGILKAAIKTDKFEIKKALPQYRKYFRNFFEVVDPAILEKFQGKRICVLDDVLSSGSTLLAIMRSVSDYNPTSVIGTAIFKTH